MTRNGALTLADLKAVGAARATPHELDGLGTVYIRPMSAGVMVTLGETGIEATSEVAWPHMLADTLVDGAGRPMCESVDDAREVLDALPIGVAGEIMNAIGELTESSIKDTMGKSPEPPASDSPST